jgi:hypothetical protein
MGKCAGGLSKPILLSSDIFIAFAGGFPLRRLTSPGGAAPSARSLRFFRWRRARLRLQPAFVVVILQIFLGIRRGVREYVAAVVLLVAAAVMMMFVPKIPYHHIYQAHNFTELFHALLLCLTFPQTNAYVGAVANVPLVVYTLAIVKTRPVRESPHWIIVGIAVWLFVQSLSLSYGRGMWASSSRYLDVIIIVLPINFCILLFAQNVPRTMGGKTIAVFATIG